MFNKFSNKLIFPIAAICLLGFTIPTFAITPKHWQDNTQASFDSGVTDGTIITNLGEIKLSGKSDLLAKLDGKSTILYDMQYIGSKLYLAAGPQGTLLERADGEISTIATLKNEQIFSLGKYRGKLLVAISGSPSKLAVLEGGKLKTIATLKDVRYIWDTLSDGNNIIVATGTDGKILSVTPDVSNSASTNEDKDNKNSSTQATTQPGKSKTKVTTILDTKQKNIMTLGRDGKGRIYAGTDTNGLVYRLTKNDGKYDSYVLYQAAEPEIDTLLVLPDGTVYAGTSNAKQARPGQLKKPSKKQTGKPVVSKDKSLEKEKPNGESKSKSNKEQSKKTSSQDNSDAKDKTLSKQTTSESKKQDEDKSSKDKNASKVNKTPTPQQYDKLKIAVQKRLKEARESGELASSGSAPMSGSSSSNSASSGPNRVESVARQVSNKKGNAIYKIDPQGFVHEIFRESVMILNIAQDNNNLIVTTGNEGKIYKINPNTGVTSILAKLKPEQLPAITKNPKGDILIGSANPASLIKLSDNSLTSGTYTSKTMDAKQISLWGKLNLTASLPVNSSVTVQTRSGNISDPDKGGWSKWSVKQGFSHSNQKSWMQPRQMKIQSPPARFLQYRLELKGKKASQPVVHGVNLAYVTPNLKPKISSITGEYPKGQKGNPPSTKMKVKWKVSDANDDSLNYTLAYRRAGSDKWINIKKDIDKTSFDWQTRQVPDGYYQLRVTASDSPDNPPSMALKSMRDSNPVLVDNTAPTITNLAHRAGANYLAINGVAKDKYSNIAEIGYVIDSKDNYVTVLPDDFLFDSTQEKFHVKITNLKSGAHVVTLRVKDYRGNTSYKSIPFTISNTK